MVFLHSGSIYAGSILHARLRAPWRNVHGKSEYFLIDEILSQFHPPSRTLLSSLHHWLVTQGAVGISSWTDLDSNLGSTIHREMLNLSQLSFLICKLETISNSRCPWKVHREMHSVSMVSSNRSGSGLGTLEWLGKASLGWRHLRWCWILRRSQSCKEWAEGHSRWGNIHCTCPRWPNLTIGYFSTSSLPSTLGTHPQVTHHDLITFLTCEIPATSHLILPRRETQGLSQGWVSSGPRTM